MKYTRCQCQGCQNKLDCLFVRISAFMTLCLKPLSKDKAERTFLFKIVLISFPSFDKHLTETSTHDEVQSTPLIVLIMTWSNIVRFHLRIFLAFITE